MSVPKLHLAVNHLIFLTKDERYNVFNGEKIETVGVAIPVWFWSGNTTEPANEVFCKYLITNEPTNETISMRKDGFEINTPQLEKMEKITPKNKTAIGNAKKLLDAKDGGSEWLEYKVFNKIKALGFDHPINVVHTIEIKSIDKLIASLSL